jgi:hypothetical protein
MSNTPEFTVGSTVHYRGALDHPEDGYSVRVIWVRQGILGDGRQLNGDPDDRIFYSLRGHGYRTPERRTGHWSVVTTCTGRCILESNLYEPPNPADFLV